MSMPRCPPRVVSELNAEEKELHDRCSHAVDILFKDQFITKAANGALIGPFAPLLYTPAIMDAYEVMGMAITKTLNLSAAAKETAILVVASILETKYVVYAHKKVAQSVGMSNEQIELIAKARKPEGKDKLDEECEVAFDVAFCLARTPGPLSNDLWTRAQQKFGREGVLGLVHLCGYYAQTCYLLNAVDVPIPEHE